MTDPPTPLGAAGTPHEVGATTPPGTAGAPHVTGAPTSQGAVGVDPLTAPLTYPGTPPWRPAVLVTDAAVLALQPRHDAPLGQWLLQTDDVGAFPGPTSRGRLPQGTTPGDLNSPDTFTGETQSRSPTAGRRDAFKARADNAEADRAMAGDAEPNDAEADRAEPDRAEPDGTQPDSAELDSAELDSAELDSAKTDCAGPDAADPPDLQRLTLDRYLQNAGGSPVASLVPVLAVGSNASPAQLRRKLAHAGLPTLVPITAVRVSGLAVGVSAHVSRPGYLPATPVPDDGAVSDLWLVWLDAAALAAVDATEPNYERIPLPTRYPVRLTTGQPIMPCWVYLSRHGYLINEAGEPRRLTDQATLISALLAGIPALRTLGGTSPQEWIERTHDPVARDAIREAFRSAGLVRSTAGL
jgi:hypothetical protein